jgi:hypothetical protein
LETAESASGEKQEQLEETQDQMEELQVQLDAAHAEIKAAQKKMKRLETQVQNAAVGPVGTTLKTHLKPLMVSSQSQETVVEANNIVESSRTTLKAPSKPRKPRSQTSRSNASTMIVSAEEDVTDSAAGSQQRVKKSKAKERDPSTAGLNAEEPSEREQRKDKKKRSQEDKSAVEEEEVAPKKVKRRLNVLGEGSNPSFNWGVVQVRPNLLFVKCKVVGLHLFRVLIAHWAFPLSCHLSRRLFP